MKIVMLQDVKGVGKKLDVKEVSDGFARNFLIPKKLAAIANKEALSKKTFIEEEQKINLDLYQKFVSGLANETLEFSIATGKSGEVFDPINKDKIKKALEEKGYKDFEVLLEQSIKTLGEQLVDIKFPQGLKGVLKVIVKQLAE